MQYTGGTCHIACSLRLRSVLIRQQPPQATLLLNRNRLDQDAIIDG